jgi:hypothetical protein
MAKKQTTNDQPIHGGHSGLHIPDSVRSKTAGSEPYSIEDAHNSPTRTGLQPRKKK